MVRHTGADTKQEILNAATRLFSDYGYRGTSLSDIAHEIGYSKASVLYHFASKEALLAELIAPAAADLQALLARVSTLPLAQARRSAIEGYADLTVTYREAVAVLQTEEPVLLQDPHFHAIGVLYERLVRVLQGEDPNPQAQVAAIMVIVGTAAVCTKRADLPPEQLQPALVAVALRALGLPADSPPGRPDPAAPALLLPTHLPSTPLLLTPPRTYDRSSTLGVHVATLLYRLGRGSFRHRRIVLAVWFVLLAGFAVGAAMLAGPSTTKLTIPGTEAQRALDSLATQFPAASGGSGSIVVAAPAGRTVIDARGQAAIAAVTAQARRLPDVAAVLDPAQTGQVSRDKSVAVARVQFTKPVDELAASTKDAFNAIGAVAARQGFTVAHGGDIATGQPAIGGTEGIGVLVAALVLVLTFGSLVAAGMTLLTALIGLGVGIAGVYMLSGVVSFNATTPILALMLGLAVGIDYSLFITSRHRHNLLEEMEPDEAAGRAVGTAGSAVVFAGATVIIALAGLSVVGIQFLATMGLAAAATVLVAVLVALTLSPALLGFAGRRVLPRRLRDPEAARAALDAEESPKLMGHRWAELVTHHRAVVLGVGVLTLGALSLPALSMQTSLPDAGHSPVHATARIAYDLITKGFGEGSNGPLIVVVDATSPATLSATTATVTRQLAATPGVVMVAPPTVSPRGTTALLQVVPSTGPSDPKTADLVHAIRHRVAGTSSARVSVTGLTAVGIDVSQKLNQALPIYLLLVIGLSFVLLMLMFRSVLVPLKAALGFLLTIGATFGATVAVFQWGWLSATVGLARPGPLLSFMPIMMIGVLFGLAMDYEVFLVSRMREEYVHGESAREATISGFSHGARVVTAAAAIMISIFAAFVFSEDSTIKSMGFVLATGVAIDAFVVRMTLVPAAMSLLADRAWWLPRWLARLLPDLDIEGKLLRTDDHPASPAGDPISKEA